MSLEHITRCDGCGKETRTPGSEGWVRVSAKYVPERDVHQSMAFGVRLDYPASVYLNDRKVGDGDLCSPECAGKWLFR